jgi:modulator of FtsH protease
MKQNNPWGPNSNMNQRPKSQAQTIDQFSTDHQIAANKVLRNTYLMLSMTLLFSAMTAAVSMSMGSIPINPIMMLIIYFGLLFAVNKTKNSPMGIVFTFALTGFLGFVIGPILNFYITTFSNGSELILMALGSTALIFFGLSALALNPRRNFTRMGGFLSIGIIVTLVAIVANLFLQIPALALAISVILALISGALIMWQTNMIVKGGETNYIMATITLYVSIFNIFIVILQFLGMFAGDRN